MSESKPPCHYATASTANLNKHNNDTRIVEFIHDLKEAIQNGEFQQMDEPPPPQQQSPANENEKIIAEQSAQSITMISSLINVNNLSNQTFNYIISWLKQQQHQIEENKVIEFSNININKTNAKLAQSEAKLFSFFENFRLVVVNKF